METLKITQKRMFANTKTFLESVRSTLSLCCKEILYFTVFEFYRIAIKNSFLVGNICNHSDQNHPNLVASERQKIIAQGSALW